LRIAIDATSLLLPGAGVRTYVHHWLNSLREAAEQGGDRIATYIPGIEVPDSLEHLKAAPGTLNHVRLRTVQFMNSLRLSRNPLLNLFLPGADIFHCSQHTACLPLFKKTSATLFDLSCWVTPQYHTPKNIAATRRYGETILAACHGVISISDHSRKDAIEILGIPAERIRVIYPGVAESYFDATGVEAAVTREKYQLARPYLLFVGCIEPRKNVPNLIRAYLCLRESLRDDVQLVLAGPFGWRGEETTELLGRSNGTIRHLGYVGEEDLPGLFKGAAALVYPSFYEGFGLPVAQAMAVGTAVITSNRSSLPEVVGDAAVCVDPDSIEELSDAMDRVLSDTELARTLAERASSRAQRFRWAAAASESLRFFHDCRRT